MPVLILQLSEGPRVGTPGVVDEDVDATHLLGRRGYESFHIARNADVGDLGVDVSSRLPQLIASYNEGSSWRAQIATATPSASNSSAIAKPRPPDPPVITALRPARFNSILLPLPLAGQELVQAFLGRDRAGPRLGASTKAITSNDS